MYQKITDLPKELIESIIDKYATIYQSNLAMLDYEVNIDPDMSIWISCGDFIASIEPYLKPNRFKIVMRKEGITFDSLSTLRQEIDQMYMMLEIMNEIKLRLRED